MTKKKVPFNFIFDYLLPLEVTVKQLFGMWAIYINEKIMLILRDRLDHQDTNGIWIATTREDHESLKKEFPSLLSISTYSKDFKETEWQVLPSSEDNFESYSRGVCELIKRHDPRIGRISIPRRSLTVKKKTGF